MQQPDPHIAGIRRDYRMAMLDEHEAGDEPVSFFRRWFGEAEAAHIDEVNAMTVATTDAYGLPHARIVLLKGIDTGFTFFTNYDSAKGRQLAAQPAAALLFFWKELERQVRIEGSIEKMDAAASDAYFHSRPVGSRIGAWASPQSSIIESRKVLEDAEDFYKEKFGAGEIPRPQHWGGYRVIPRLMEFWQGRSSRLHDRIVFERDENGWNKYRLAP